MCIEIAFEELNYLMKSFFQIGSVCFIDLSFCIVFDPRFLLFFPILLLQRGRIWRQSIFRNNNKLTLTPEGELFYKSAEELLAHADSV